MRKILMAIVIGFSLTLSSASFAQSPILTVSGNIITSASATVSEADIAKIGKAEITTSIFVLGEQQHKVSGVLLRDLFKHFNGKGETIKVTALDGYVMDIPVADFMRYDVILGTEMDGKKFSVRDKGPAWIIYPVTANPELKDTIYEARSVWQVKDIEFN